MCDVLFVVPSSRATMFESFHGTLLLATILRQNGISADIHQFYEACDGLDLQKGIKQTGFAAFRDRTAELILAREPKIVSFYCRCDSYLANLLIAQKLKQMRPELFVVFGGPQADVVARETMEEIPWVDFCCRGEGETTVYPLFSALLNKGDYTQVSGLFYRNAAGEIVANPEPPLVEDLDSLPHIDFGLIPQVAADYTVQKNKATTIEVGRGCPFNCAYCSSSLFWKRKFRMKSAQRILDEMLETYRHYGIKKFVFEHDLFTANKKKVLEFSNLLKNSNVDFAWACSSRVDTLDEEMVKAMAEVGLKSVYLGVESGSARMQKLMNKHLKIEDVIRVATLLKDYQIKFKASFIYALPEETEEDLEQTLQVAYKLWRLGAVDLQFHLCVIFPGTEYYRRYADSITLTSTQSDVVGDLGVSENQKFIKDHPKLFSYCYEYKNELSSKYPDLMLYAQPVFRLWDKLVQLMPERFGCKRLTELVYEVVQLYDAYPATKNDHEIAMDYVERYFTGDEQRKMMSVLSYFEARDKAAADPGFAVDFKTYPINVTDVINGKPLSEIAEQECVVCFKREDKRIKSYVMPKQG